MYIGQAVLIWYSNKQIQNLSQIPPKNINILQEQEIKTIKEKKKIIMIYLFLKHFIHYTS